MVSEEDAGSVYVATSDGSGDRILTEGLGVVGVWTSLCFSVDIAVSLIINADMAAMFAVYVTSCQTLDCEVGSR